jgi:hypothetical protein
MLQFLIHFCLCLTDSTVSTLSAVLGVIKGVVTISDNQLSHRPFGEGPNET